MWVLFGVSIFLNLFILINAFIPGNESAESSSWIAILCAHVINLFKAGTINDTNMEAFSAFIRKFVGHFSLFLVDGVISSLYLHFLRLVYPTLKWWMTLLISFLSGLFIASLSEFIQIFIPGRVGALSDVLIDSGGYVVGLLAVVFVFLLLALLALKRKKKNTSEDI